MCKLTKKDYWNYFRKVKLSKNISIGFPHKETFFGFSSPLFNFSVGKWYVIIRLNKIIFARGFLGMLNIYKDLKIHNRNCKII